MCASKPNNEAKGNNTIRTRASIGNFKATVLDGSLLQSMLAITNYRDLRVEMQQIQ
jgi:hypothetical protein